MAVQPLPRSAPRAFPTTLSPLPPEEETVGTPDDVEGPETGLPEGPPGGIPGAPGTGRPGPGTDLLTEPPRPGGDIHAPDLVRRVEPIYPETARRARLEGLVVLDAVIAVTGDIEDVRVVKSAGPLLDSAAAEAVRRWKYRPATLNGRAVRVLLSVSVSFRLH